VASGIIDVLHFAIDGVTAQTNAATNNLANVDTPNYTDTEVNFQQSLQDALTSPDGGTAQVTTTPSVAAPATNGNNVDLAGELVDAEKDALQYQTISEGLNAQFRLIAGAAGGSYT
jgi:flagellar basal-body rod protein FlgB